MIKITEEIADLLDDLFPRVGLINEFGAVVGDAEFILYYKNDENTPCLAHISEFEQRGILIKLKEKNEENK